jgi:hypothetical protein
VTTPFELFTARFQRFDPSMGTPVQAANGKPRWALKYDLRYAVKETFPAWALVQRSRADDIDQAEFSQLYQQGLDRVGVEKLTSRFRAIAVAEGDPRLVLLCYEDLTKPGWWCHRTMFAEWWTRQTGDPVIELGPPGSTAPPPAPEPEPSLFD